MIKHATPDLPSPESCPHDAAEMDTAAYADGMCPLCMAARIEQLEADHLDAIQLSREWMAKHDRLLGFIQARPAVLKELIASDAAATLAREEG